VGLYGFQNKKRGKHEKEKREEQRSRTAASRLACPGPQVEGHKTEQESRYVDRSIRARL